LTRSLPSLPSPSIPPSLPSFLARLLPSPSPPSPNQTLKTPYSQSKILSNATSLPSGPKPSKTTMEMFLSSTHRGRSKGSGRYLDDLSLAMGRRSSEKPPARIKDIGRRRKGRGRREKGEKGW